MNFSDLSEISGAYSCSRILQIAVKLGIFEEIENNNNTFTEVAKALNTNIRATDLYLNALVALGFLIKKEGPF